MSNDNDSGYNDAIGGNEKALAVFLSSVREFDEEFCRNMVDGTRFNLRLEVHGSNGKLIHTRVYLDRMRQMSEPSKAGV